MRRKTDAAALFGELVRVIRIAGSGNSMRAIGQKVGGYASTVSKVEKAERALKQHSVSLWAQALEVDEAALGELWWLAQGLVPVEDGHVFYTNLSNPFGGDPLPSSLEIRNEDRAIHRLAFRIIRVLERALPTVQIGLAQYEPLFINDSGGWGSPEDEDADWGALAEPVIEIYWRHDGHEFDRAAIRVPKLAPPPPITRKRGSSVTESELAELIESLTALERERVRGYIEAILDGRSTI